MKLEKKNLFGIVVGLVILIVNIAFLRSNAAFWFVLGIAVVIAVMPFIVGVVLEVGREKEKESMFLEFSRDLTESVNSGIPISKSILNVEKDYGSLSVHVNKLKNQISIGIPFRKALHIFAEDSKNKVIQRGVSIIIEAEEFGGEIGSTLESVVKSVNKIENLKKERSAAVYNQVVQGYIIFSLFIVIMLVLQIWLLPQMLQLTQDVNVGDENSQLSADNVEFFNLIFIILIIVQGLFMGLVIGKLSEGRLLPGLKHSFILVSISYLIITGVSALGY